MAEKRKVNHQSAIIRYLDREFFAKVLEGTEVQAKDNIQDTIDTLLQKARTLRNDFIDGIESDLLVIVVDSEYRKGMKKFLTIYQTEQIQRNKQLVCMILLEFMNQQDYQKV